MNTTTLRDKIFEKGHTVTSLAAEIGMARATLYRKMKDKSFPVREAAAISQALELSREEVLSIFFYP